MGKFLNLSLVIGFCVGTGLVFMPNTQAADNNKDAKADKQAENSTEPWTDWLDRDDPSGYGDYETVNDFLDEGILDSEPVGIQCRTRDGQPWQAAGQVYSCTAEVGGVCVNSKQPEGVQCLDYEVRFRYQPNKP